jgi:nickel/cobalt exporter
MLRIIFLLSSWISLSWGCLACSYGDIKVLTHLYLNVEKNTLKSIDVEWTLDPMFSQMVLGDFDLNRNGKFEKSEKYEVYKAIEAMNEVGFFIRPTLNNRKIWLKELKNFTVRHEKGLVIYRFTIPTNEPIRQTLHLRIAYDANVAFNNGIIYHLNDKNVFLNPPKAAQLSTKLFVPKISKGSDSILDIFLSPRTIALASPLGGNVQNSGNQSEFSQSLRTVTEKIHGALVEAQENPSFATIGAILLFSLLYGILHAAGPGHGKTLVASYFTTNARSYTRGITIALLIAITHVVSAFFITMILYWFVHTMFSQTITDVSLYMTKFSGIVIVGIALYLARQKWSYYRPKLKAMTFSSTAPHQSSCVCHSCKATSNATDLMLILGAGIVPCPGTIVVFLFTISMGMYLLGALSAVVMSLGMGLTIAITAALGTALRRKSASGGENYLKTIDILGVGVMFCAGLFLTLA